MLAGLLLAAVLPSASYARAPKPHIIAAADWGSQPGDRSLAKPQDHWEWITLHHASVRWSADKDALRFVCNLQEWSESPPDPPRKAVWADVPYHFMVAPDGRIFQGRDIHLQPATNTGYDVSGNITIELMGDFEAQRPRPAQLRAAAALTAWLAQKYGIALDHVRGHKDAPGDVSTDCPGRDFYRYLRPEPGYPDGRFRAWVADFEAGLAPDVEPGPALPEGPTELSPAGLPAAQGLARCPAR
ncbi:MAG: N-acetylmuramoyl-L-alanine amidase, partial [Elusimicrobia bacterium]|nr:N-acetylmuramoyl-L-alanine amidase [Elusimicrobiota bacterium]